MKARALNASCILEMLKESYHEWSEDNATLLSAALSFRAIFSIAPLLLILVGILSMVYGEQAAQGKLVEQLGTVVPQKIAETLQGVLASDHGKGGGATIFGVIALLFGASTVVAQLKQSLNIIWEVKPKAGGGVWGFIRERLLSFAMILVIGFLLLVSLVLTTVVAALGDYVEQAIGMPKAVSMILAILLPLAITTVLFAAIFKVLPDAEIPWKSVWIGALVTAVLFEIGKVALSFYFAKVGGGSGSGLFGGAILLLLWVNYAAMILFFGAEFTEVYSRKFAHKIVPSENAEFVSEEEQSPVSARGKKGRSSGSRGAISGSGRGAATAHEPVSTGPLSSANETSQQIPSKESLTPLIVESAMGGMEPVTSLGVVADYQGAEARSNERPIAEVGAALGVGLLIGIISRFADRDRGSTRTDYTAKEHFALGGQAAAAAGLAGLAALKAQLGRRKYREKVKHYVEETGDAMGHMGQKVQKKVQQVVR